MAMLNTPALYLPQLTITKPDYPAVPIFTTHQDTLKTKKSVIIIVNDHLQDLGVWAYRRICDESFDHGSSTGTVKALNTIKLRHGFYEFEPGVVIFNPGQYYYSYKEGLALSHESWEALPRQSLYHDTVKADEEHNFVDGSRSRDEHVATVFKDIILNTQYVAYDAELYIIGICEGSNTIIKFLNENWVALGSRVKAAAWVHPHIVPEELKPTLAAFIEHRTRSWMLSGAPQDTCVGMPSHEVKPERPEFGAPRNWEDQDNDKEEEMVYCPTFSGGEDEWTECIFPKVQRSMFEFFTDVSRGGREYKNPLFEVVKPAKAESSEDEPSGQGVNIEVKDANRDGDLLPPDTADTKQVTEKVKEVELGDDEVEVAGVPMPKDLLTKAGID
jgi:hypothetical protein